MTKVLMFIILVAVLVVSGCDHYRVPPIKVYSGEVVW